MSEWVRLDAEKLNTPQLEAIRGVNITVRMSPYDVPEAVRGYYDEELERFVIEFRYIGDEPFRQKQKGEHITLRIGRHSGRLYGVEVNVDAMKAPRGFANDPAPALTGFRSRHTGIIAAVLMLLGNSGFQPAKLTLNHAGMMPELPERRRYSQTPSQTVDLELKVSDAVLQAIDSLPRKHPRHENYEVAKDTITQKKGEIFASLAAG